MIRANVGWPIKEKFRIAYSCSIHFVRDNFGMPMSKKAPVNSGFFLLDYFTCEIPVSIVEIYV